MRHLIEVIRREENIVTALAVLTYELLGIPRKTPS